MSQRAHDLAPWLVLLLLAAQLTGRGGNRSAAPRDRSLEIVRAFEGAPYEIGAWLGADVDQSAARESGLLPAPAGARRILARRYTNSSDGREVELTIVHSTDHHDVHEVDPARLYPSNGWVREAEPAEPATVRAGRGEVEWRVERYRLLERLGGVRRVRVYSTFTGATSGAPDAPSVWTVDPPPPPRGATGHVRIVVSGEWDPEVARHVLSEIVDGIEPLVKTLNR